jgi:hypothetical protein
VLAALQSLTVSSTWASSSAFFKPFSQRAYQRCVKLKTHFQNIWTDFLSYFSQCSTSGPGSSSLDRLTKVLDQLKIAAVTPMAAQSNGVAGHHLPIIRQHSSPVPVSPRLALVSSSVQTNGIAHRHSTESATHSYQSLQRNIFRYGTQNL